MERLYCQGVVATGYGIRNTSSNHMTISNLERSGLRPKVKIGAGLRVIKGFNARGVSIVKCLTPEEVAKVLEEIADAEIFAHTQIGKRQQILDNWVKEQNDD